ncbi:MAG: NTP transferase domain-containing protein [Clostridium sp.]
MSMVKTAVILAAGMGSRLYDVTNDEIPKGFLVVNGKSLIERSIEKLRSIGIEKIYIVTGHLNEYYDKLAEKYNFIETKRNRRYRTTGSMTSLSILENELKEDFLLLESDLIYEVYGLTKTAMFEGEDCILLSGKTNSGDECYVEVRNNNLYKISKDINEINEVYGELVGISKISKGLYKDMIKEYRKFMENLKYNFGDSNEASKTNERYDYEDAIFDAAKYRKVGYLKIDNLIWGEIDNRNQMERVEKIIIPRLEKVNL